MKKENKQIANAGSNAEGVLAVKRNMKWRGPNVSTVVRQVTFSKIVLSDFIMLRKRVVPRRKRKGMQ